MEIEDFVEARYGVELVPGEESIEEAALRVVSKEDPMQLTKADLQTLQEDAKRQKRAHGAIIEFHEKALQTLEAGGYETLEDGPLTNDDLLGLLDEAMRDQGFSVESEPPVPMSEVQMRVGN